MICLVVDSTCDIPQEWREHYRPEVLPLVVSVEGREYLDQVDIQLDELHGYMRRGIVPKTAQVPAQQMYDIFGRHLERGEDAVSYTHLFDRCFNARFDRFVTSCFGLIY